MRPRVQRTVEPRFRKEKNLSSSLPSWTAPPVVRRCTLSTPDRSRTHAPHPPAPRSCAPSERQTWRDPRALAYLSPSGCRQERFDTSPYVRPPARTANQEQRRPESMQHSRRCPASDTLHSKTSRRVFHPRGSPRGLPSVPADAARQKSE